MSSVYSHIRQSRPKDVPATVRTANTPARFEYIPNINKSVNLNMMYNTLSRDEQHKILLHTRNLRFASLSSIVLRNINNKTDSHTKARTYNLGNSYVNLYVQPNEICFTYTPPINVLKKIINTVTEPNNQTEFRLKLTKQNMTSNVLSNQSSNGSHEVLCNIVLIIPISTVCWDQAMKLKHRLTKKAAVCQSELPSSIIFRDGFRFFADVMNIAANRMSVDAGSLFGQSSLFDTVQCSLNIKKNVDGWNFKADEWISPQSMQTFVVYTSDDINVAERSARYNWAHKMLHSFRTNNSTKQSSVRERRSFAKMIDVLLKRNEKYIPIESLLVK